MSIASGEWWIQEDGFTMYADGDIGDYNHERMALESILAGYDVDVEDPKTPDIMAGMDSDARRFLKKKGVPKKVIELIETGDPREYMIEHRGWIRLAGAAAELWEFDEPTLASLRSGIYDAWTADSWDEMDPEELDFDVTIEEAKTRRTFDVPLLVLMDERMDAESLKRLGAEGEIVQAPSAPALRAAWGRKAARERGVEENPKIPQDLAGLAAEAKKYATFEEFEHAFLGEIKHGTYWHFTDDHDFRIDPKKGPTDQSTFSFGETSPGKLMITSHFDAWAGYGRRRYAALIDMSRVPPNQYWQVNRGFGNEFFVDDPSKARVTGVYPIAKARKIDRRRHSALPQNSEELEMLYNEMHTERGLEKNPKRKKRRRRR